ncbi:Ubiquitin-like modifier-activating enzyme atg7 [Temnothorax longispinosus]|uniref:Ubiquitin-like modifier-activating enzyme atg7 n=1 Tax=Temnothorax longispinosus TaxID=300112 RepID=A0A4V6RGR2_9HYME|nr:Ubiquitin-like modifier-activating enzyme atg7 [Temnothorax longispinosus]
MSEAIRFTKLKTTTDPTFWAKFAELKIDKLKLDEKSKIHLWGSFSLRPRDEGRTNPLTLDCTSFNENLESTSHNAGVACHGYMINTNTYEAFRQINPEKFIDTMGQCVIDSIRDGTALQEPWQLSVFLGEVYFAFYDPCASAEPGWPLRNLLCLLYRHCSSYCFTNDVKVLSIRSDKVETAVIFTLRIKEDKDMETTPEEHLVGWEANVNGKMGPNIVDLSNIMDPTKLSDRAINLNLKLMKWRLVPDLDLEKISGLRCLLLGAGTLGCSVARVLLGWGINNMTLVDNSTVSHSNTVRQSLYTHEDAVQRRHKAHAAKDALLRIRPSMASTSLLNLLNVEGVILHIPMPGHVVGQSMMETTREAVSKLQELVNSHDVVFLLLDSREARWLPTLMCAATNKIAINAALGFDSYTVQRHGMRDLSDSDSPKLTVQNPAGHDLGCYFCNDVTQPGNSQTDRTLDLQCTVSRPGLSQIAAGLAVELLMAVTQHPQGILARALMDNDRDDCRENVDNPLVGLLGGVPHTIRGSLWGNEMKLTVTHRSPFCTACSTPLIEEYQQRDFAFVLDACNVPNYLEKLSGLEEILKRPDLDELCYTIDTSSEDEES